MDRKKLIELFQKGLQYPSGKHRFLVLRCFEITVHPDQMVELDEYESFVTEEKLPTGQKERPSRRKGDEMFHVGKSILHLKDGRVVEEVGGGWRADGSEKA